jgi:hypothetical protein
MCLYVYMLSPKKVRLKYKTGKVLSYLDMYACVNGFARARIYVYVCVCVCVYVCIYLFVYVYKF